MNKPVELELILIEDNPEDAELTIRALKSHNLANYLIWLKDGAEANDFIFGEGENKGHEFNKMPKVILLDLKLPKISGIELLEKIRANEKTKLIPVVILTSSREEKDIAKTYDLGANSYIVKPVEFGKFVEAIKELGLYWLLINQPPR